MAIQPINPSGSPFGGFEQRWRNPQESTQQPEQKQGSGQEAPEPKKEAPAETAEQKATKEEERKKILAARLQQDEYRAQEIRRQLGL